MLNLPFLPYLYALPLSFDLGIIQPNITLLFINPCIFKAGIFIAFPARMPPMSDTKNGWLAKDGWVKRVQNVNGVEVHYIKNTKTGEETDFKFKD